MAVRTPDRHLTFAKWPRSGLWTILEVGVWFKPIESTASILQRLPVSTLSFTMGFSTTRPTVREAISHASMRSSSATARWRRSCNARDAASKASHWAALAGNARAKIGRAPA